MARAYVAISIVTVLWAANFTVGKVATYEINPWFLAGIRVILTAAVFWSMLPRAERRITRDDVRAVLPMALTGIALNHTCFAAGIMRTTPSHSAIIHALIPVIVAALAWPMLRERLRAPGMFGMALAVAGALVVVAGAGSSTFRGTTAGDVITSGGVMAFSFYVVWGRKVLGTRGGFRTLALAFVLAVPVMVPVLAYGAAVQEWGAVTWKGWAALAYMWIAANLLSYWLHIYALGRLSAGRVAAFIDLQPAIGITIAVLAGEDELTGPVVWGGALALVGVVLVQVRRRALGHPAP